MNRNILLTGALFCALSLMLTRAAKADPPSGAIFTTLSDGSEVNYNHYPSKQAVYLDGGPGPGAPQTAAGLDDGRYVFQVTDPSGKTLLSTDKARSRQFDVLNGIIVDVVVQGDNSQHKTGVDIDHNAVTVQLFPYNDTPNPGGVYKVWVCLVSDYLAGCVKLGVNNGLDVVDPGFKPGNAHGFIPGESKTDNFKVKDVPVIECDTTFVDDATGQVVDGLGITWIDPVGGSNEKHSYYAPTLNVIHEAHVEAMEVGTHTIVIDDGPGYHIDTIFCPDGTQISGPGSVKVKISTDKKALSAGIKVIVVFD